jgi:ISXO2 transposase-like protein
MFVEPTYLSELLDPVNRVPRREVVCRLNSYQGACKLGYTHVVGSISASDDPAHVVMPAVHRVASLLKRWLLGTHQGSVAEQHLDAYLDEFVFRFNRRHQPQAWPALLPTARTGRPSAADDVRDDRLVAARPGIDGAWTATCSAAVSATDTR